MILKWYLYLIVPAAVLVPAGTGIFRFRNLQAPGRLIFWYLLFSTIVGSAALLLSSNQINNMPLLHIYTAAEFIFCALFFKKALEGTLLSKLIIYCIPLFLLFCILNVLFIQDIYSYNSYSRSLSALLLIIFCLALFYRLLDVKTERNTALLWINMGFFFYFCGSLFLFVFSEFIAVERNVYMLALAIHASLVLLMYVFFTVSFLKAGRHDRV